MTYEVLGQFLGYCRASLTGLIVTRLRVSTPSGETRVLSNQAQYELDRSAGKVIQEGDSGAPVYHKLAGRSEVELVSMVYAFDELDPVVFYAMPFPDVATALEIRVP